jgi:hypothetical protein
LQSLIQITMIQIMNKAENFVDAMIGGTLVAHPGVLKTVAGLSRRITLPYPRQFFRRTAAVLLAFILIIGLLPGFATARTAAIVPVDGPVLAGQPVMFRSSGDEKVHWNLGDGSTAKGSSVKHVYRKPGIYRVVVGSKVGDKFDELSSAIVRVHTMETLHLPQILLDSDVANEIDDQHAVAYALFSELDVLAITTLTWIGWGNPEQSQLLETDYCGEERSYQELLRVLDHALNSGLPDERVPMIFRGAKHPLRSVGIASDRWFDTEPVITEASNAILAAARGASPDNPVWVLPVGPITNIASALLQVRQEGWEAEFQKRIRICWLGGGPDGASTWANGNRDTWAPWVTYKSGIEFVMFLERPTGFSIDFNPNTDVSRYPGNPLGDYLKTITTDYIERWKGTARVEPHKGMYDLGVLSYVISEHLRKPWIRRVEPSILLPQSPYRLQSTKESTNLNVVHEIDHEAIKKDFFNTLNSKPTALPPNR